MKKVMIVCIIVCLFMTGCFTANLPSVCDTAPADSVLCKISNESDKIRLEDIGNGMIIVNTILISEGVYSKEDAATVLTGLIDALEKSLTYAVFKDIVLEYTAEYPELVQIAGIYLDEFSVSRLMSDFDRNILLKWANNRLNNL